MLPPRSNFSCRRRYTTLSLALSLCCLGVLTASAQSAKKRSSPTPKPSASPSASAGPSPGASPVATPYTLPDPVAKVDGQPVSKADLERVTNTLLQNNGRSLRDLAPADQRRAYQTVIEDLVMDKILTRESAGETVPDLEIETQYGALRNEYPTPETFDAELKKSNQTPDQVRQNIRLQLAQKHWIESQTADQTKVTPQEVEKFYKEGPPSKFDAPETVRASQLLVSVKKDAPPEEALVAEKKINALAERIKKGEAFDKVANESAENPSAKPNGGDMGYISRDRIMPEFAEAAFKLKVGEVSPPVRTQFGYHLIKVTDRKPAHHADFNEVSDQITAYLQNEKRQAAVAALVKSLREKANVEIFLP